MSLSKIPTFEERQSEYMRIIGNIEKWFQEYFKFRGTYTLNVTKSQIFMMCDKMLSYRDSYLNILANFIKEKICNNTTCISGSYSNQYCPFEKTYTFSVMNRDCLICPGLHSVLFPYKRIISDLRYLFNYEDDMKHFCSYPMFVILASFLYIIHFVEEEKKIGCGNIGIKMENQREAKKFTDVLILH